MPMEPTTLSQFLAEQLPGSPDSPGLGCLLADVAIAVQSIAAITARGALADAQPELPLGQDNHQGEAQKALDILAHQALVSACEWGSPLSGLAGLASEEQEAPQALPQAAHGPRFLLLFDPLDGSSNIDVNVAVGTIFSVLRHEAGTEPGLPHYLQPGHRQVAAGYAIYGPATMLVLTLGRGTHGFTLCRDSGCFLLTHPDLAIPAQTSEFAINTSNERFWEVPVRRYVSECKAGAPGARGRDFNMRWIASMVAEVHRILMRGGVRLMYEANPMAWLVEQAGGAASTGQGRLLDVLPRELHQRVPVVLGSRDEVERIERYHAEHERGDDVAFVSPLFNERSLYRPEAWADTSQ
jgi:fructose-1,6-bisphosphatase I/sedoheptulose-1,7-bisphosphatase